MYRPYGFDSIPPVVKNLLILNALAWLATLAFLSMGWADLPSTLGLFYPGSVYFKPLQFSTYMFMHGSFTHLLYNMLALWMFGSLLESYWGPKRFLLFYLTTAIGAALMHIGVTAWEIHGLQQQIDLYKSNPDVSQLSLLLQEDHTLFIKPEIQRFLDLFLADPNNSQIIQESKDLVDLLPIRKMNVPVVGASGAIFGILMAGFLLYPNTEMMILFFPFPIKVKYLVSVLAFMELYEIVGNKPFDNVAHFAHLGGMLFGWILVKYWNKTDRNRFY